MKISVQIYEEKERYWLRCMPPPPIELMTLHKKVAHPMSITDLSKVIQLKVREAY